MKKPWWQHEAAIAWALILFFPLGIFMMWRYAPWRNRFKWLWTTAGAIVVLLVVAGVVGDGETKDSSASVLTTTTPQVGPAVAPTMTTQQLTYVQAVVTQEGERAQVATITAEQTKAAQPTETPEPTQTPTSTPTPTASEASNGFDVLLHFEIEVTRDGCRGASGRLCLEILLAGAETLGDDGPGMEDLPPCMRPARDYVIAAHRDIAAFAAVAKTDFEVWSIGYELFDEDGYMAKADAAVDENAKACQAVGWPEGSGP